MYWLRHVHDRARAALSILKISEIEEILVPFVAKFAQATIKPYYLEREIFVKRCNRICFGVRQISKSPSHIKSFPDNDNKEHFKIFGSLSPSLSVEFSQDEEHVEIVLTAILVNC
jgi:hypothetical protein